MHLASFPKVSFHKSVPNVFVVPLASALSAAAAPCLFSLQPLLLQPLLLQPLLLQPLLLQPLLLQPLLLQPMLLPPFAAAAPAAAAYVRLLV
jgi:hypothetical protein